MRLPGGEVQARLALQSAVGMALALLLMRLLPLPKGYWLPLTVFIATSASLGETAAKSLERIVGTAAGLLTGEAVWLVAGWSRPAMLVFIAACLFGLYYGRAARYRVMLFWLSLLLSLLMHLGAAPTPFYVARLIDTLIGAAIAVLVTTVLMPVRTAAAVSGRIALLLEIVADRLDAAAAMLRLPAPQQPPAMSGEAAEAARALHTLASAESLEATLLHRPRLGQAHCAAADRIVLCLLVLDRVLPSLSGGTAGTTALVRAAAGEMRAAARAIRAGRPAPPIAVGRLAPSSAERADAADRDGAARARLQAELRLRQVLTELLDAASALAANAPPAHPRARGGWALRLRPPARNPR